MTACYLCPAAGVMQAMTFESCGAAAQHAISRGANKSAIEGITMIWWIVALAIGIPVGGFA